MYTVVGLYVNLWGSVKYSSREQMVCSMPPITIKTGYLPISHHHMHSTMHTYPPNSHQTTVPSTFPLSSKDKLQPQLELVRHCLDDVGPDGQVSMYVSEGRHIGYVFEMDGNYCYIPHKELQEIPQETTHQTLSDIPTNISLFHLLYYLI